MGLSADRYHEVWSALGGSNKPRAVHDYSSTGWSRTANRATTLITELESETAAINRDLLYVKNATAFPLYDDHLRMASRSVVEITYLKQHNNPKKGLGPVGNALCSALNPFFIACNFTRTGEACSDGARGFDEWSFASIAGCYLCPRQKQQNYIISPPDCYICSNLLF